MGAGAPKPGDAPPVGTMTQCFADPTGSGAELLIEAPPEHLPMGLRLHRQPRRLRPLTLGACLDEPPLQVLTRETERLQIDPLFP